MFCMILSSLSPPFFTDHAWAFDIPQKYVALTAQTAVMRLKSERQLVAGVRGSAMIYKPCRASCLRQEFMLFNLTSQCC